MLRRSTPPRRGSPKRDADQRSADHGGARLFAPPHHHAGHGHDGPRKKPFHKDWRLWVVVALMLLGIIVYILTLDESVRP